jgi:CRISPR-associated exonuclease Cas4
MRGQAVHASVDTPGLETRAGVRVERSLPIWSDRLGLVGKADVVEFLVDGSPYPVEYKHGSRHKAAAIALCDDVQLGAQALCLEEMTGKPVSSGAIFYARSKRRREVPITDALRTYIAETLAAVRAMLDSGNLPPVITDRVRCRECSLKEICQPEGMATLSESYMDTALFDPDV